MWIHLIDLFLLNKNEVTLNIEWRLLLESPASLKYITHCANICPLKMKKKMSLL